MIWLLVDSGSVGGIERHVATLAQALPRFGYRAEIIVLSDHGDNPWYRQLKASKLPYRIIGGARGLFKALRRERPGLLHTHGYKSNVIGRLAARLLSIPVVSTFHAGERAAFPVNLYQRIDEYTSILGGRICVSDAICKMLPFEAAICDNFILAPPTPSEQPLPRHIAFVGRLSHEKAPDIFCDMARRHAGAGEWHVYGDGPMRADLEARFSDVAIFHGLVADLAPVWPTVGLLVMPSRAEGMPMAALEALSEGIPILASAVGGLPNLVIDGTTGWLFEAGSIDGAGRGIRTWSALSEHDQRAMRRSTWELVRNGYSESRHLPTILDSYQAAGFRTQSSQALATQCSNHREASVRISP